MDNIIVMGITVGKTNQFKMNPCLPGAASLVQDIDKKMMVTLRDGRIYIGYLRTVDQFANLVLHQTYERIHVENKYCDVYRGIFLIRGENVVLVGEIDTHFDLDAHCERVPEAKIFELQRTQQEIKDAASERKRRIFRERGIMAHLNEMLMDDN